MNTRILHRDSNFELLRILSMFGIVSMHIFGQFYACATGINLIYGVLINSIFNMGVTIFMLISGYYGIQFTLEKFLKLEIMVIFYSVLDTLIQGFYSQDLTIKMIIKAMLPVSTRKYWYISVYMIIFVLSKYINLISEKMDKKNFKQLIILLLIIFSIIPTFVNVHVMQDNGKGLMNMFLIYLIGRYIRKYSEEIGYTTKQMIFVCMGSVLGGFILNYLCSIKAGGVGLYCPFARDYSIIIVMGSVSLFLLFKKIEIKSNIVNKMASCTFAVYLFEGIMRKTLNVSGVLESYRDEWYLFAVIAIYVILIMLICSIIEGIRTITFSKIEKVIVTFIDKKFTYFNIFS